MANGQVAPHADKSLAIRRLWRWLGAIGYSLPQAVTAQAVAAVLLISIVALGQLVAGWRVGLGLALLACYFQLALGHLLGRILWNHKFAQVVTWLVILVSAIMIAFDS